MAGNSVGAGQIDPDEVDAILSKLGIDAIALSEFGTRLDALESAPAAPSFDVGDYCWSSRAAKPKWLLCQGQAISRTTYVALFGVIGTRYGTGDGSTTFNLPNSQGRSLLAAGTGTVVEAVASASWNAATDVITVASNADKWPTGRKVRLTTTGTLPTGFALATDYFVIRVSATTIRLATSLASALAGSGVNFTTAGTGTHTITHTFTPRALGDMGGEETHPLSIDEMPTHDHTNGATASGSSFAPGDGSGPSTLSQTNTGQTGGSLPHNIMSPFQVENLFVYTGV